MKKKLHINNDHLSNIFEYFGKDFNYNTDPVADNNITTNILGFLPTTSDDVAVQSGNTATRPALFKTTVNSLVNTAILEEVEIDLNNINTIANEPYNQLNILRSYNTIITDINKLDDSIYSDVIIILLGNLLQSINFEKIDKAKLEEIKSYI